MSELLPPPQLIEVNNAALPLSKMTAQIFLKLKNLKQPSKASGIDNVNAQDLHSIGEPIIDSFMTIFKKNIDILKIPYKYGKDQVK